MKIVRAIIVCLLLFSVLLCVACGGEDVFDYKTEDMTKYVSFGDKDYRDVAFSIKDTITDADVKKDFDVYFSSSSQPYYQPIADTTRPVANGDYLYLMYSGVTVAALEKAVGEGEIPDVDCTGMTYSEICALELGFKGGTSSALSPLKIGSKQFIDGFETGLIGAVPADRGEENPVRLHLTFPTNYSSAELAGAEVVFFCKLYHIGDVEAGFYNSENISVDMLNIILGKTGDKAYASIEACLEEIREYLEKNLKASLPNAKATALYTALTKMATFQNIPDSLITQYIDEWFATRFAYVQSTNPQLYAYYFDPTNPSRATLATLFGYGEDYMDVIRQEGELAIRQELVFRYIVQIEGYAVTEEIYAKWDAKYKADYGEDYREGVEEEEVRDQMLRDEVTEILVKIAEERGNVTHTS